LERAAPAIGGSRSTALDDALREATDYGLLALGEIVRETIYQRIERTHQVKRKEIPEKLDTFHKALQGTLGAAAKVIERLIAKNFYSRLDLDFTEHNDWTIVEYFDHAKTARGGELHLDLIKSHSNVIIVGPKVGVVKSQ
jgi:hypothetical protein